MNHGMSLGGNDADEVKRVWVLETRNNERHGRFRAVEEIVKDPALKHPTIAAHSITAAGRRVLRLEESGFSSNLQTYMENADVNQTDAYIIFSAILSAVRFLHSRQIAHCNINPREVYIWQNPESGRVVQAKLGGIYCAHYESDAPGFLLASREQRLVSPLGLRHQQTPSSQAEFGSAVSPCDGGGSGGGSELESLDARLPPELVELLRNSGPSSGQEDEANMSMNFAAECASTQYFTDTFRDRLGNEHSTSFQAGLNAFAADSWALGIVLYQLLNRGELPFPINSQDGLMIFPRGFTGFFFTKSHAAGSRRPLPARAPVASTGTPPVGGVTQPPSNSLRLPTAPTYPGHAEPKVEAALLRKLIPRLLCPAEKRLNSWQADSLLLHWTMLLDHGFPINKKHQATSRTLFAAISHSAGPRLDDIVALLQQGHDPLYDNRRPDRRTPLHAAVEISDEALATEVCNLLLTSAKKPARLIEVQSRRGKTPLMRTVDDLANRRFGLFNFLLKRVNELDVVTIPANIKVLRHCAEKDLVEELSLMLSLWYDLSWPNAMLSKVVEEACAKNAIRTCKAIIDRVPVAMRGNEVARAIQAAAENSHVEGCEALFKYIVSVDSGIKDVSSMATIALFAACNNDLGDVVELALKHNGDPLAFDPDGNTPVVLASTKGHRSALAALFTHIPKAKSALATAQCDAKGRTPLHYAALNGWDGCVSMLLDNGASVNAADPERYTPLHLAAFNGFSGVCRTLIDNNAWIDASLVDGTTPALMAAMNGQVECIRDALVPNGASLARYVDVGYRTVYDELLLQLQELTDRLNTLEKCKGRKMLIGGCLLWCFAIVAWFTIVAEATTISWSQIAVIIGFFFTHIAFMVVARYNVVDRLSNQEFFNDLMPVRTILKSSNAGVPVPLGEEAQFRVGALRSELGRLKRGLDVATLDVQEAQELRDRLQKWVKDFPRLGKKEKEAAAAECPSARPNLPNSTPPALAAIISVSQDSAARPILTSDAYAHAQVEVTDEIQFLDEKLSKTFNPSRQQTLREAYLSTLSRAERSEGTSILEMPSPFANWATFRLNAKAFFMTFQAHLVLRLASTFLMIVIFAGFGAAVFNADGAVAFHFANTQYLRCMNPDAIRCASWETDVSWMSTGNPDCCFGDTPDDTRWCPGRGEAPPPAVGNATANETDELIPEGLGSDLRLDEDDIMTRFVYVRNGEFEGRRKPIAEVRVHGCSLTNPRPRVQVRVLFETTPEFFRRLDAISAFIFIGGIAVFAAQLVVTVRFARRRTFSYLLYTTTRFETSLLKFYFLSTIHCGYALLSCQMAIRLWTREPFARIEKIGLSLAVLSIYPGLMIISWLPLIGPVVGRTLLTVLLGLIFVLGMVLVFPLIPAMEAFSIPFFVTDPQRAIVSFAEKTSSRLFYIAIAVFWLLLVLRVLTAAAEALAPDSSGRYYNEVMRQYRLQLARLLPRRDQRKGIKVVVAADGGSDNNSNGGGGSNLSEQATGNADGANDPYLLNESMVGLPGKSSLGYTPHFAASVHSAQPPVAPIST